MLKGLFLFYLIYFFSYLFQAITEDGTKEDGSTSPADFALLIAQFTSSLSSGIITEDIITISQKILQAKVTAAPSNAILILLKIAASTASSLQVTILSEIVIIRQNLIQVLVSEGLSLTSITFKIQDFDSEGAIIVIEEAGGKADATQDELEANIDAFGKSQTILTQIEILLKATLAFDFSSLSEPPTSEVTIMEFMTKLSSFLMIVGKDMSNSKVTEIGQELITMKINMKASTTILSKLSFIISTVTTYVVQVTTEITNVRGEMKNDADILLTITTAEDAQKQVTTLTSAMDTFSSVSTAITKAMESSDKSAANSVLTFFSDSKSFFIIISSLQIDTTISDSIDEISTIRKKIISASDEGVTPSSGKLKLIFMTIIQSITIFIKIINIQIQLLGTIDGVTTPVKETTIEQGTTPTVSDIPPLQDTQEQPQSTAEPEGCPVGFEPGDWSNGDGECCCDPNNQPDEEEGEEPVLLDEEELEAPVLINGIGEEPILINGNSSGYGEEPVLIGGEEPVEVGEESVLIGGEEPVLIGGEEPVLIEGEKPVDMGGEHPVSIGGETPIQIEGGTTTSITKPAVYCKCRPSSTPKPASSLKPGETTASTDKTSLPPLLSSSLPPPRTSTATGSTQSGKISPESLSVPATSNKPRPTPSRTTPSSTGQLPFKLTSTTPAMMGSIPFKLPKSTTPSTKPKGQVPYKLPKRTTLKPRTTKNPTGMLRRLAKAAGMMG